MKKELRKIVKDIFSKNSFSELGFESVKSDFDYDLTFRLRLNGEYYFILLNFCSKYEAISMYFGWSRTGDVPVKWLIPDESTYAMEESAYFDIHFLDNTHKSNSFERYDVYPGKHFIAPGEMDEFKLRANELCNKIKTYLLKNVKLALLKRQSECALYK